MDTFKYVALVVACSAVIFAVGTGLFIYSMAVLGPIWGPLVAVWIMLTAGFAYAMRPVKSNYNRYR